jgi:hypothetical protein
MRISHLLLRVSQFLLRMSQFLLRVSQFLHFIIIAVTPPQPVQPGSCYPNPCGPYSICSVVGPRPVCECQPGYFGRPPNCHPECLRNSDCTPNKACINEQCVDPCPGVCGANAVCQTVNHNPICSCPPGYTGDPFNNCLRIPGRMITFCNNFSVFLNYLQVFNNKTPFLIYARYTANNIDDDPPNQTTTDVDDNEDPCSSNPCGPNTVHRVVKGSCMCICIPNYIGDPFSGCRPECVLNSDCPRDRACRTEHCHDPCPGACGLNAICTTINHKPSCQCKSGTRGNPYEACLTPEEPLSRKLTLTI